MNFGGIIGPRPHKEYPIPPGMVALVYLGTKLLRVGAFMSSEQHVISQSRLVISVSFAIRSQQLVTFRTRRGDGGVPPGLLLMLGVDRAERA